MATSTVRPAAGSARPAARAAGRRRGATAPALEHRILTTATFCLLAFGAVMVYSASSPIGVLQGSRYGTGDFLHYLMAAGLGLVVMQVLARRGLALLHPRLVRALLVGSLALLLLVLVPGFGVQVLGARRWFSAGPIQFQPSEVAKLAIILYAARHVAENPRQLRRGFRQALVPIAVIAGPGCLLIVLEPDLGTALVIVLALGALLLTAGIPLRHLGMALAIGVVLVGAMALARPYQLARLTAFLHPWAVKSTAGFQEVQGQISLGSGGLFGVGLGQGVQKDFYLPEAQTDFILGVVGEELGVLGICGVVVLYGMIAYAGLRTARRATERYAKLLAAGLTSLILCQGTLNIFVVLGIAPLTGVPLPFISYAPTNLVVMLAAVGLLLNISASSAAREPGARRRADAAPATSSSTRAARGATTPHAGERPEDRDRRRRDRWARRAGPGGRGRLAG